VAVYYGMSVDRSPKILRYTATTTMVQHARYQLRSATGTNYSVPRTRTKFGDRAFSVAGPLVWNSLPAAVRHADSLHSFNADSNRTFLACVLMIDSV